MGHLPPNSKPFIASHGNLYILRSNDTASYKPQCWPKFLAEGLRTDTQPLLASRLSSCPSAPASGLPGAAATTVVLS
jgi:hypothetical protein